MKKVENTGKNGILKKFIILFIAISMVILIGIAYARYITRLNGSTSMEIAKWSFNHRILDSTQTEEINNFAVTRTDNNDDVDPNTIAPGTSGEFIIEIDATRNRNFTDL